MSTVEAPTVQVGDIFVSQWYGDGSTYVDFYEVVKVTASSKSVYVRRIAGAATDDHHVVPATDDQRFHKRHWDTDPHCDDPDVYNPPVLKRPKPWVINGETTLAIYGVPGYSADLCRDRDREYEQIWGMSQHPNSALIAGLEELLDLVGPPPPAP